MEQYFHPISNNINNVQTQYCSHHGADNGKGGHQGRPSHLPNKESVPA